MVLRGVVDRRTGSDETNLIINELTPPEEMTKRCTTGVKIRLDEQQHGVEDVERLYEILRRYPGNRSVELLFALSDGTQVHCECDDVQIDIDAELRDRVAALLGSGNLRPITSTPRVATSNGNGRRQPTGAATSR